MLGLTYIGSFQNERVLIRSEDPMNEVWNHIARFGTSYLEKNLKPDKSDIPWEKYLEYTKIRTRQALEFRHASRDASLLTAPLTLYYSFLNLTRAFLAMGPEVMPKPVHGLRFLPGADLLSSNAQFTKGTFTDYLDTHGVEWNVGMQISLSDALGFVVEFAADYRLFDRKRVHVQAISVDATTNGRVRLKFLEYPGDFVSEWKADFPELSDACTASEEATLTVSDGGMEYGAIADFLENRLLPGLALQNHPTWYAFRKKNGVIKLTRAAYYYLAIFILGSAVRYEPELILSATATDSEIGWMLSRFVKLAERFFPQLKLMELYKSQVYFSANST